MGLYYLLSIDTSHPNKPILFEGQGGFGFQTAGTRLYVEDLEPESSTVVGPKDFFEMLVYFSAVL